MNAPWPGETMPLPPRYSGRRIVAAYKIPTAAGQPAHQWYAIVEDTAGGATFTVGRLVYRGTGGFGWLNESLPGLGYRDASSVWLRLVQAVSN